MLQGRGVRVIVRTLRWQQITAIIIPAVTSVTLLATGMYGPLQDRQQIECWITKPIYQLFYYVLVFISVICDVALLCYTLIVLKTLPETIKGLLRRVLLFVVCDLVVYTIPMISRGYGIFGYKPPYWLGALHNMLLASIGLVNAIIWGTISTFEPLRFENLKLTWLKKSMWCSKRNLQGEIIKNLSVGLLESDTQSHFSLSESESTEGLLPLVELDSSP
jgi:hypothetical protein